MCFKITTLAVSAVTGAVSDTRVRKVALILDHKTKKTRPIHQILIVSKNNMVFIMQFEGVLWDAELNFMYYSYKMLQLHSFVHGCAKKSFFFFFFKEPLFLSLVLHFASFDTLEDYQNV